MNSLAKLVLASAKTYHDKIAIRIKSNSITYQCLIDKATQVALALINNGANKEAIGLVGQRHFSSYVGIIGILFSGCWYVPINPKLSKGKIISIINDSSIRLLVGDLDSLSIIDDFLKDESCRVIDKKVIPFELSPNEGDWIDEECLSNIEGELSVDNINRSDLAYVMYTSGSTGNPKGVQVTNGNVLSWIHNMSLLYKCKVGFVASQTYDLSFDLSVGDVFHTLVNGGILCVLPENEKLLPIEFIKREKIEFWSSVPTVLNFMSKMEGLTKNSFPSIRYSLFCGEPFPKRLAKQWSLAAPNSSVENLYGPTEATIWLTRYKFDENDPGSGRNGILPIGQPFYGHQVEVISEDGNILEKCKEGELVYKGQQITNGYVNDQEKTNSSFVKFDWDPSGAIWYKSGDLGFYNNSGELECIGRKDNQLKVGGRRIEIGEIENALAQFSQLQDAVVVALKDENMTVKGIVAFTMNEISKEDLHKIRQESNKYIEREFFPKTIVTVDDFPRTLSGKIDRKELLEMFKRMT